MLSILANSFMTATRMSYGNRQNAKPIHSSGYVAPATRHPYAPKGKRWFYYL